ncbi:hypothetical protein B0I35DRAFT_435889 [Stachybotrys elegans]|uniref:Calpain catalytic domain-containing protein n=1 Tax=Stachybotrys elegans TaxID=80388 RepID=A0A8K0SNW0_9HYPO|nr:hypothetical protein B0I35DRAFT_435889 [Stachybotrys elegans]
MHSLYAESDGSDSPYPSPGFEPPKGRDRKHKTPQDVIDEFWSKFATKQPGRATTVIPQSTYLDKAARKAAKAASPSIIATASYDDAAAMCRAKVEKIVNECRRINKKYRDPYFDLETDLKFHRRDCLESLCNDNWGNMNPGHDFNPGSAKRVVDIFDQPKFYIDGPSAGDVRQGRDGDCWLMAALCLLSTNPGLIERLCVAMDQDVGVYGFVFYRDGEWISEIVDDFLYLTRADYDASYLDRLLFDELERVNPEEAYRKIYQTNSSSLYFAQCRDPQETWLPLLEKCYAKAHGDYAAINGGFGGEGIEDLTGGMTSEIWTTDILDKENFWKELLQVNKTFLFGCSTGVFGRGVSDPNGIIDRHAYSIQKAVEMDGKRLLRLKNPWGRGEWRGAWSDGSKEWTPQWLERLGHSFGDDGEFWISYEDLLRKYQAFERTRLFDEQWRVTQVWTTLNVPWAADYHDTHFSFSISEPGPVVLVLAQLDERYFRGLEGQYRFELGFRLHKAGHQEYMVRSQKPYRMRRSANMELELEAGDYDVRVKVEATRYETKMPIHEVIRKNVKNRREKLTRIGIAYDLAHSKGRLVETEEEKQLREAHEKKVREKERQHIKEKILASRQESYYLRTKQFERDRRRRKKRAKAQTGREALVLHGSRNGDGPKLKTYPANGEPHQPDKNGGYTNGHTLEGEEQKDQNCQDTQPEESADTEGLEETVLGEVSAAAIDEAGELLSASVHFDDTIGAAQEPQTGGAFTERDTVSMKDSDGEPDDFSDIESLSELSERELDIQIDSYQKDFKRPVAATYATKNFEERPNEFEKDPWNAVVVVGLRIYYQTTDGSSREVTKLRVVRPNAYSDDEEDGEAQKTQGLDVDDSAKDATLKGGVQERKKSIMGDGKEEA